MIREPATRRHNKFLSTLSLRRATRGARILDQLPSRFLSTLSLRRATCYPTAPGAYRVYFYPRSPCGERPAALPEPRDLHDFYPRSPCGERQCDRDRSRHLHRISIHALLAESDGTLLTLITGFLGFLSTLSLRRATCFFCVKLQLQLTFLSTLSLRRATVDYYVIRC